MRHIRFYFFIFMLLPSAAWCDESAVDYESKGTDDEFLSVTNDLVLEEDGLVLEEDGLVLEEDGLVLEEDGLVLEEDGLVLETVENTAQFESDIVKGELFDHRVMRGEVIDISGGTAGQDMGQVLSSVVSSRLTDHGSRLQRKGVAFRGAASQDVVVRYHGIVMNALSDASADLGMIPAELLDSAVFFSSGAGVVSGGSGGLVELMGEHANVPVRAVLTGGTLGDFDLFVSGGHHADRGKISGAAFGSYSLGRFPYIDTQGSLQIREHNAASRIGGQLHGEIETGVGVISGLSFFSAVDRQEAGLSEYPARYARATQEHWLSLSRLGMTFEPVTAGNALASYRLEVTHRASHDVYDNPTAFIGSTQTHSDYLENRTTFLAGASFMAGSWSQTHLELSYDGQHVSSSHLVSGHIRYQTHQRHFFALGAGEQVAFLNDEIRAGIKLRMETDFKSKPMFEGGIGVTWQPLEWLEIWGAASLAERRPSFDELYYETEYIRGNADLQEQRTLSGELGFSVHPAAWLMFKVNGFYHHHNELIRFMPVTPYLYQARNITDVSSRGVEFILRSQSWRDFSVEGRYAWVNAVTGSGYPMPTTPEHHVHAALSWDDKVWHAAIKVDYSTEVPRNMTGTLFTDPKLRLNMELGFQFYSGWRLDIVLNNLLDDREAQDALQRPLPGRHAFISLSFAPEY